LISRLACQQRTGSERNCFAWLQEPSRSVLETLGAEYLQGLQAGSASGVRHITDKMVSNFWFIGFIHLILPRARIIHVQRDARDNCLSIFTNYFSDNLQYAHDLRELGRFYRLYESVMNHWRAVLPGRLCETSYEKLVADPEDEVRRLLDYCRLPFDRNCLRYYENKRAVQTTSFAQVRRPLYKSSIGRWKRYEQMLRPLLEVLEER
jgi:hypothetical protein